MVGSSLLFGRTAGTATYPLLQFLLGTALCIIITEGCGRSTQVVDRYPDGTILTRYEVKGNVKHGQFEEFYENGNLFMKGQFLNDTVTGMFTVYFPTGKTRYRLEYDRGRLRHIHEYFDQLGNALDPGNFSDGNGSVNVYNTSGKLRETGQYVDGWRHGTWLRHSNAGVGDSLTYNFGKSREPHPIFTHFYW